MTHGTLKALQKPGKPKDPKSNLQPIIPLSILRKILAVCVMKRINLSLDSAIPISQEAYCKNRSITEHVFATKLIERKTSLTDEIVYLILLDMSKAVESIKRNTLTEDLNNILNQDELHLIRIPALCENCSQTRYLQKSIFQYGHKTPSRRFPVSSLFP